MSIAELFDSEFKKKHKGRFSAVARILFADGKFDPDEKMFLDQLSEKLEITSEEYDEILKNPLKHEINPPYLYEDRLESLYNFSRVVHYYHHLGNKQEILLKKFAVALGFPIDNVDNIVNEALVLIEKKADLDSFIDEMKHTHH